jgi:soluble lytic murein transglycosylase
MKSVTELQPVALEGNNPSLVSFRGSFHYYLLRSISLVLIVVPLTLGLFGFNQILNFSQDILGRAASLQITRLLQIYRQQQIPTYSFKGHSYGLGKTINKYHLSNITFEEFRDFVDPTLRRYYFIKQKKNESLDSILRIHFETAHKYQVDPFWALAVTWTESHFRKDVVSSVGATGLMQIMPDTAEFLKNKVPEINQKYADKNLYDVVYNIELGMYYLNYLQRRFYGRLDLATVAYNMGPNWVSKRLKNGLPVGQSNLYLEKVKLRYSDLTAVYVEQVKSQSYKKIENWVVLSQQAKDSIGNDLYWEVCEDYAPFKYDRLNYVLRKNPGLKSFVMIDPYDSIDNHHVFFSWPKLIAMAN